MLEVMEVALKGVGYGIFNYIFLFAVWLVYIIVRRLVTMDYYRMSKKKPFLFYISDLILQGIIIGVITSLIIVSLGIPLQISDLYIFLIPLSLMLSILRLRFLCISYSAGLLAIVSLIGNGQQILGFTMPNIELHIPSLIIIVGILHLMEGILVLFTAKDSAIPVLTKRDNQVMMGHVIQKSWPIPLAFLVIEFTSRIAGATIDVPEWWPLINYVGENPELIYTILPTIGLLSYTTITYAETPKERSRFSGTSIFVYSVIVVALGVLSVNSYVVQIIGVIFMTLMHEGIYYLELVREKGKSPLYFVPEEGIRIMHVIEGGFAEKVGLKQGDIIEKFNGIVIRDVQHFIKLVKGTKESIILGTQSLQGKKTELKIDDSKDLEQIGIRIIPDKPLILFPFSYLENVGIFNFLRRNQQ